MTKKTAQGDRRAAQKYICQNRRALHNFAIEERLEAGLVLQGSEVKALRLGRAHLNDAYVQISRNEAVLLGGHIGEYAWANQFSHTATRSRKLLLHRREIDKLARSIREKGYTAVALSLYFTPGGHVKLEVGVGRGKSDVDRRHDLKAREADREMTRALRQKNR
jgi:SsrA-binding protein